MTELVDRVRAVLPSVRKDLEDLIRIESVWADPARRTEVHRSARAVADLLTAVASLPKLRLRFPIGALLSCLSLGTTSATGARS